MSLPDHQQLKELFESNPEGFEAEKKRLIDEHISAQPKKSQDSLRNLQDSLNSKP